jgi:hypothetical protein
MNRINNLGRTAGLILCGAMFSGLTGCIGYVDAPRRERVYVRPAPVHVEFVSDDDYVYYPGYQVYYSSSRRHYVYLEGRSWVARPAPPRVSVDVLFASPSVRLGFRDAPAAHHSTIVKQYPKHWAPPKGGPNHSDGNGNGNGRDKDRGNDKDKNKDKDHGGRK